MASLKTAAKTATGSYFNRLNVSKEAKDAAQVQRNVKQSGIQLQRDIFDCENIVAQCEAKVETLKNSFPLNSGSILDAQSDLAIAQGNLEALNTLQEELFPG